MSAAARGLVPLVVHRPPDRLAAHLVWAALTIAFVLGAFWLMRRSWRRRARTQTVALPAPAALPVDDLASLPAQALEPIAGPVEGMFLGTTRAGAWLERIVAHGLGTRGRAEVAVTPDGLLVARAGARSFLVPASDLRAVRLDTAHGGRVTTDGGIVVVAWRLGEQDVESGFRPDDPDAAVDLVRALRALGAGDGEQGPIDGTPGDDTELGRTA